MKGLLLKDLALMKTQGRSVAIIMIIAFFMMFVGDNITFAIVYANMIFVMFGISTLSYDVFDNGYAFLFTLPITRKLYVLEKYVFSILCIFTGVVFAFVMIFLTSLVKEQYVFTSSEVSFVLGYAIGAIIFLALILPVELKFGPEKGRIAMIIVFAIIMASGFALKEIVGNVDFSPVLAKLSSITPVLILGILAVVGIIILFASYMISCKIMMKKEF